jgi:hypothetical protein
VLINRYFQLVVTTAALLALAVTAAQAADVPHISGGIGSAEREELQAKERDYTSKSSRRRNPVTIFPASWS